MEQIRPTTRASTSRPTGSGEAKITTSARPIHPRQGNSSRAVCCMPTHYAAIATRSSFFVAITTSA